MCAGGHREGALVVAATLPRERCLALATADAGLPPLVRAAFGHVLATAHVPLLPRPTAEAAAAGGGAGITAARRGGGAAADAAVEAAQAGRSCLMLADEMLSEASDRLQDACAQAEAAVGEAATARQRVSRHVADRAAKANAKANAHADDGADDGADYGADDGASARTAASAAAMDAAGLTSALELACAACALSRSLIELGHVAPTPPPLRAFGAQDGARTGGGHVSGVSLRSELTTLLVHLAAAAELQLLGRYDALNTAVGAATALGAFARPATPRVARHGAADALFNAGGGSGSRTGSLIARTSTLACAALQSLDQLAAEGIHREDSHPSAFDELREAATPTPLLVRLLQVRPVASKPPSRSPLPPFPSSLCPAPFHRALDCH